MKIYKQKHTIISFKNLHYYFFNRVCEAIDVFKIVIFVDNIKKIVRIVIHLKRQLMNIDFTQKIVQKMIQVYYFLIAFFDKIKIKIEYFKSIFIIRFIVVTNSINLNMNISNIFKIVQ